MLNILIKQTYANYNCKLKVLKFFYFFLLHTL